MSGPQAVVFDLDGTLARTADPGFPQTPYLVLDRVGRRAASELSFGEDVCRLPGRLISRGYPVAVVIRSPLRYASTLLGVLGVDYLRLLSASAGRDLSAKLREVARGFGLTPDSLLYVADTDDDARAARVHGSRVRPG